MYNYAEKLDDAGAAQDDDLFTSDQHPKPAICVTPSRFRDLFGRIITLPVDCDAFTPCAPPKTSLPPCPTIPLERSSLPRQYAHRHWTLFLGLSHSRSVIWFTWICEREEDAKDIDDLRHSPRTGSLKSPFVFDFLQILLLDR